MRRTEIILLTFMLAGLAFGVYETRHDRVLQDEQYRQGITRAELHRQIQKNHDLTQLADKEVEIGGALVSRRRDSSLTKGICQEAVARFGNTRMTLESLHPTPADSNGMRLRTLFAKINLLYANLANECVSYPRPYAEMDPVLRPTGLLAKWVVDSASKK